MKIIIGNKNLAEVTLNANLGVTPLVYSIGWTRLRNPVRHVIVQEVRLPIQRKIRTHYYENHN